jgi:DNA-binding transcriptional ArsR family regulator
VDARNPRSAPTGLEKVRALSHPLRLKLLELFAKQARTTKQAAEALGEPPTRLYHHVAALEHAGLVRLRETRPNRGTIEKYYEAVSAHALSRAEAAAMLRDHTPRDRAAIGMVVFDQARNELVRAMAAGASGPPPALFAIRGLLRLSPVGARRVRRELQRLLGRLRAVAAGSRGSKPHRLERYSLTLALLPAEDDDAT